MSAPKPAWWKNTAATRPRPKAFASNNVPCGPGSQNARAPWPHRAGSGTVGAPADRLDRPADGAEQETSSSTPAAAIDQRLKLPSLRMLDLIATLSAGH